MPGETICEKAAGESATAINVFDGDRTALMLLIMDTNLIS
jgi:hypothetical protein